MFSGKWHCLKEVDTLVLIKRKGSTQPSDVSIPKDATSLFMYFHEFYAYMSWNCSSAKEVGNTNFITALSE